MESEIFLEWTDYSTTERVKLTLSVGWSWDWAWGQLAGHYNIQRNGPIQPKLANYHITSWRNALHSSCPSLCPNLLGGYGSVPLYNYSVSYLHAKRIKIDMLKLYLYEYATACYVTDSRLTSVTCGESWFSICWNMHCWCDRCTLQWISQQVISYQSEGYWVD